MNRTDHRLLFLPNDRFAGTLHLTCSIMVPPKTIIRIPSLCYVSYLRLTGSPLWPPENAVGFASCGFYKWEMNLFGNQDACKEAGWRRTTLHGKPATAAARQDVEAFVNLIHRLDFQRIRSPTSGVPSGLHRAEASRRRPCSLKTVSSIYVPLGKFAEKQLEQQRIAIDPKPNDHHGIESVQAGKKG